MTFYPPFIIELSTVAANMTTREAAMRLPEIAQRVGVRVKAEIGGIECYAWPTDTPKEVADKYFPIIKAEDGT